MSRVRASPEECTPDYVTEVIRETSSTQLTPFRQAVTQCTAQPIVISVIKNERHLLPDFFLHYRRAGIERFVIIDNGSHDGTLEYVMPFPDVDLYLKDGPFHWKLKQGWINQAIALNGHDRWYIYADADEHIVFDGIGRSTFGDLAAHMDRNNIRRVRGVLVDMYSAEPVSSTAIEPGHRLSQAFPYFDSTGYNEARYQQVISRKGGPRQRVFGPADVQFRPEMTKYPLFKPAEGELFVNPHHHWPYSENFRSACYLGILHYKFLPTLGDKIRKAIEDKNYWNESFEYRCYLKILQEAPHLSLMYEGSARYEGPASLVRHGLIEPVTTGAANSTS